MGLMIAVMLLRSYGSFFAIAYLWKDALLLLHSLPLSTFLFCPFYSSMSKPDLGTSVIILGIAAIMFLFVGIQRSSIILGIMGVLIVSVGAYFTVLKDYQKQRLVSF